MKILHIISNLDNGGAEGVLSRLITNDSKFEHEVVSLMDKGIYGDYLEQHGVAVRTINLSRTKLSLKPLRVLYTLIKESKPDVVQTWMYHADLIGGTLSSLAGVKHILWGIRGPYDKQRTSLSTKVVVFFCVLLSRIVPRCIISNSFFAKQAHVAVGYPEQSFSIIPNGYNFNEEVFNSEARQKIIHDLDIAEGVVVYGMVARFDTHKDHANLFKAIKVLAEKNLNFLCLLVGPAMDSKNHELADMINHYEIGHVVQLLGPRNDVPEIMSVLDVHVLSSAAESFPNVLAEAMLSGTPCVSTDVGDAKVILGETGWLVPARDFRALAKGIEEATSAMHDVEGWKKRKALCQKRIKENFGLEKMISAYHQIWRTVTNG